MSFHCRVISVFLKKQHESATEFYNDRAQIVRTKVRVTATFDILSGLHPLSSAHIKNSGVKMNLF